MPHGSSDKVTRTVLYVDSVPYLGGAEISLLLLMGCLDPNRYVPYLVTSEEAELARHARDQGVEVLLQRFPWLSRRRPWIYAGSVWRLWHTIRQRCVSLVHTNCPHSLRHVRQACRWSGVPYVTHVRDLRHAWFQPGQLARLNRARWVIANSQAIAKAFAAEGVQPNRVRVVYNPFDIARFQREPSASGLEVRASLGIPSDAFVIGIVGQIQAIKGHEELIRGAPQVLSQVSNARFLVAGAAFTEGCRAFQSHLYRLITHLGLTARFHFVGFRNDTPALLKSLDVLAAPSWSEPFGRVVVEGLAAGLPVVGTRAGGIPEIIEDGVDGLLVPSRDPDALAAAIVRLARDSRLRATLSERGPGTARRFDVKHHVDQVQALYDSVLTGTGPGDT
jgi:glycosyltransferase involved in cell wall biosynthesis